jgi:hypothetical protein
VAANNDLLGMSLREILERATKLIIQNSERFPNFDRRIDLEFVFHPIDPKIGRRHRVRTKLRITAVSELFDHTDETR